MEIAANYLWNCSLFQISAISLLINLFILVSSLGCGSVLVKLFAYARVTQKPDSISRQEVLLTASTVILNSLITVLGWILWKNGIIVIKPSISIWSLADLFVLFCVMDFCMYFLHRIAHIPFLFEILHKTHHNYKNVHPITLFVLNPLENLSFGFLWLIVISVYSSSWFGISIYLTLNLLFGLIGHLGVEPLPKNLAFHPILKIFTTSTFHAEHHQFPDSNFGFYTTIWDKLLKTISPFYVSHFGKIH